MPLALASSTLGRRPALCEAFLIACVWEGTVGRRLPLPEFPGRQPNDKRVVSNTRKLVRTGISRAFLPDPASPYRATLQIFTSSAWITTPLAYGALIDTFGKHTVNRHSHKVLRDGVARRGLCTVARGFPGPERRGAGSPGPGRGASDGEELR